MEWIDIFKVKPKNWQKVLVYTNEYVKTVNNYYMAEYVTPEGRLTVTGVVEYPYFRLHIPSDFKPDSHFSLEHITPDDGIFWMPLPKEPA